MKNQSQDSELELNMEAIDAPEPEQEYSLEDIMREFGGWSKPAPEPEQEPEPAPEPEQEPEPVPEPEKKPEPAPSEKPAADKPDLMRVAAEKGEKRSFKLTDLSGDTIRFRPIREEDLPEEPEPEGSARPVEMPEEPAQPEPDAASSGRRSRPGSGRPSGFASRKRNAAGRSGPPSAPPSGKSRRLSIPLRRRPAPPIPRWAPCASG